MAAPTLTLSEQPSKIDVEEIKIITVTTDADDFQVTSGSTNIKVEKVLTDEAGVANKTFKLIGEQEGEPAKITVTASKDGEQKTVEFYCRCELLPTTLTVGEMKKDLQVSEQVELEITTNAGEYKVVLSNPNVLRVVEKLPNKIKFEAIGIGSTSIEITATKKFSTEKKFGTVVNIAKAATMDKDSLPTSLILYNPSTKKKVTFTTTNDVTHGDVVIHLPSRSGQILTEEDLGDTVGMVAKPSIIAPYNKIENYNGSFVSSKYKPMLGFSEPLKYVRWQVSLTNDFKNILVDCKIDVNATGNVEDGYSATFGIYGAVFIRIQHITESMESAWSDTLECSIAPSSIDDGLDTVKKYAGKPKLDDTYSKLNSMYYGAYYGVVPHDKLVDDYDYRGNLETLSTMEYYKGNFLNNRDLSARVYNLVNGGTQKLSERYKLTNSEADMLPIYVRAGWQYSYKGKLYYALEDMKNTYDTTTNKPIWVLPDEKDKTKNKWKEDTRTNLGTPRHVFWERVNIGFGNTSSNNDGYGSGDETIGNLVNHEEGYLKYVYKGRLCYTTPKPICKNICWNDLAKVELWGRQRTVRLGGILYYVRLMYEDEFKTLFNNLKNGTYMDTKDYAEANYALDSKVWLYDERWFTDDTKKVVRKAISKVNNDWVLEDVDPTLRTDMHLRLVLERIEEGEAPYKNVTSIYGNIINAEEEKLQYDPYTDTGYFGMTAQGAFGTTGELQTATGVGSTATGYDNNTPYWLKFYWHGLIVYVTKKPLTYNYKYQDGVDAQCITGVDMGNKDGKTVKLNNITYRIALLTAWSQSPMRHNYYYYDTGSSHMEPWENLLTEQNKYSMYEELWLRVCRNYAGYTMSQSPLDNHADNYNKNANRYTIQKGDNWAELKQTDIIGANRMGNGSYRRSREVGTKDGAKHYCGGYGYENILYSDLDDTFSATHQNHSWAPCCIPYPVNIGRSEPK